MLSSANMSLLSDTRLMLLENRSFHGMHVLETSFFFSHSYSCSQMDITVYGYLLFVIFSNNYGTLKKQLLGFVRGTTASAVRTHDSANWYFEVKF